MEAAQKWQEFEQLCLDKAQGQEVVEVAVDPATGEIVATNADGTPVPTVSADNKLPQVSPVYRKLSQLLDMGHLVSVDKTTRLALSRFQLNQNGLAWKRLSRLAR